MTQCKMVVRANPSRFQTPFSAVLYVCNLLRGPAFEWAQPMLDSDFICPPLADLPTFFSALQSVFGDSDPRSTAERSLRTLSQTSTVAAYAITFKQLTQLMGWTDSSLIYHFHTGLSSGIKDELAREQKPIIFDAYVALAIAKENRLTERNDERLSDARRRSSHSDQFNKRPPPPPFSKPVFPYNPPRPSTSLYPTLPSGTPSPNAPTPMDVDATRTKSGGLTPEERARRYELKLCAYCGAGDHLFAACPSRRPSKNAYPALP